MDCASVRQNHRKKMWNALLRPRHCVGIFLQLILHYISPQKEQHVHFSVGVCLHVPSMLVLMCTDNGDNDYTHLWHMEDMYSRKDKEQQKCITRALKWNERQEKCLAAKQTGIITAEKLSDVGVFWGGMLDKTGKENKFDTKKKCKNFLWDNKYPGALQGILSLKEMYSFCTFYEIETVLNVCCRFVFLFSYRTKKWRGSSNDIKLLYSFSLFSSFVHLNI